MTKQTVRFFLPAIILFLVMNSGFLMLMRKFESWGFDYSVLVFGNILIFGISFLSYWMATKGLSAKSSHAFVRWVYTSIMFKLFFLMLLAFAYIMIMKKDVNKPGLFFCMGLYFVYTIIEVSALMKVNKMGSNV